MRSIAGHGRASQQKRPAHVRFRSFVRFAAESGHAGRGLHLALMAIPRRRCFACCSAVMPMPVSETANSTKLLPLLTLRAASLTSPALVNLQALLRRLSRICRRRIGSTVNAPRFSGASTTRRFLFCSASCPAVEMTSLISGLHGLWVKFELSGLDLREVEHLVDKAKKVSTSAMHALKRLLRLFCAEARRVGNQHVGEPDDGVERRAQLVAHARDELRLVLASLSQLPVLILNFIEQTHVLDGDRCLVRECLDQRDLFIGEWLDLRLDKTYNALRDSFAEHWDSKHRPKGKNFLRVSECIFRVCLDVDDLHRAAFE